MMRLFIPFILVVAGITLFVMYTNPAYQGVKGLQAQAASYDEALKSAQKLRETRDSLLAKQNSFPQEDLTRLQRILPDNVDNIRFIIDINNIAARHSLALGNVNLGEGGAIEAGQAADAATGDPVGSVNVGFSVTTANYDNFLAFLQDLEHSLRLVDVKTLSFTAAEANAPVTYTLLVSTYWLH
jgi:hypothetical protein